MKKSNSNGSRHPPAESVITEKKGPTTSQQDFQIAMQNYFLGKKTAATVQYRTNW
jgi:hypothetical protein